MNSGAVVFDENGNGPFMHDCEAITDRIEAWMVRAKLTGLHPEAEKAIQQMIEDLR